MFGRIDFYHFFHEKYTNFGRWFAIKLEQSKNNNFTHRHCFMKKEFRVVKCQWQHFWFVGERNRCVCLCLSVWVSVWHTCDVTSGNPNGACVVKMLWICVFDVDNTNCCCCCCGCRFFEPQPLHVCVCLLLSSVYLLNCQTSSSFQFESNVKCNRQKDSKT